MSSPILAAYSLQDADRGPIEFAAAAARFTGAPLVVVSVRSGGSALDRLTGGEFHDDADAPGKLDALRSELAALDVPASLHAVEHHSPAGGIAAAIEELQPRLAVLGSSNRSALGRVLTGSTAERVIHGSPCPVVVVPQGHANRRRPAAGRGGVRSHPGGQGGARGRRAPRPRARTPLLAVVALNPKHAEQQSPGLMAQAHGEHDPSEDRYVRDRLVGTDALKEAVAELGEGVEVETDVLFQDPLDALTAASQRTDLLVIGSRGYGPAKAVMLGGVSRRLITTAHCPVLVLTRADGGAVAALVGAADTRPRTDRRYGTGMVPTTLVPRPGLEAIVSRPPTDAEPVVDVREPGPVRVRLDREAGAVVADLEPHAVVIGVQQDGDVRRAVRVLDGVLDGLEAREVDRGLDVRREAADRVGPRRVVANGALAAADRSASTSPSAREQVRVRHVGERPHLFDGQLDLPRELDELAARSGASPFRRSASSARLMRSATRRCCAPSWRSRSIRSRSSRGRRRASRLRLGQPLQRRLQLADQARVLEDDEPVRRRRPDQRRVRRERRVVGPRPRLAGRPRAPR